MARVFISYRRADGQYAVGWIEERLRQLDSTAQISTAFRDSDLRYGDDFPSRLADEVDDCDVLIAVIGTRWHGTTDDGPARILDPADWVGREITSALSDPDKLIVPVLLHDVEPLRAADLLPEHRRFADLHAVRFDERDDLERLAAQVERHLARLDAERARLIGLDHPLDLPRWRPSLRVGAVATLAATAGGLASWGASSIIGETDGPKPYASIAQAMFWAGAFVIGLSYTRRMLIGTIDLDLEVVARSMAIAVLLIALTVTSFAPGETDLVVVTLVEAMLAVALMSPWIFALIGPGWSRQTSTSVRRRALVIGAQRRALGVAVAVVAIALSLSVAISAIVVSDNNDDGLGSLSIVGFGIFLSLVLTGGIEFSHSRLRHDSELLRVETAELGRQSRGYVQALLVGGREDLWPGIALWLAVPTVGAIIAGIVLELA